MTPYRRKGSQCWMITVPSPEGAFIRRSSGTHDRETADAMQRMLAHFARRGTREWDLLEAVLDARVSIGKLYDHYLAGTIDGLRALLADLDLAPAIDAWAARIAREKAPETARKYLAQVAYLFPVEGGERAAVPRSRITRAWLKEQLAGVPGSNTNRRRHGAAWTSLFDDLVEAEVLAANPMREITLPPSNPSKTPHLLMHEAIQLVKLMPVGAHQALAALRHGAGVEWQAAIATRKRDIVDEANRVVWAHGQKNTHRDRQVIVEPWAWEILAEYVRRAALLPDALLFPVTKAQHAAAHEAALEALGGRGVTVPPGYTLHAARHSYAVDAMKQGRDPVLIANNLGHANTQLVLTLYGKHRPTVTDLIRADRRAREGTR